VRIALTAFEPFDGRAKNRSQELLGRVRPVSGITVDKVVLPVAFAALPQAIAAVLAGEPDAVVLMGETSAWRVAVERRAQNRIDARIPDNRGAQPRGPVVADAPPERPVSWDAAAVRDAIAAAGVRVELSDDAGSFACNAALYLALTHARCRVGFLHVPQRRWPLGPRLSSLARAVEAVLGTLG
jgi:pyroglutamyl-peptidase